MLIGGSNASGVSGNIRSGYSDSFLPCRAYAIDSGTISDYNEGKSFLYNAYVRIKNLSDDWVTIGDASYFQINNTPDGGTNTANITIQNPSTWGINGTSYPDLLRPSKRAIQIMAKIDDYDYAPIFTGRISAFQRPEGANGGAINLTCNDVRTILQRESSVSYTNEQTNNHNVRKQLLTTLRELDIGFSVEVKDQSGTFLNQGNKYSVAASSVPFGGWYITSTGNIIIGRAADPKFLIFDTNEVLKITDSNIHTATRSLDDGEGYNTVRIAGFDGSGTYTTSTVQDDTDVSYRGNIFYAGGLVGTPTSTLAEMTTVAETMIETSLKGKFNITVPFFPYLECGQMVYIQSDRFSIAPSYAWIDRVRHQYQVGNAVSYLDRIILTEI